MAWSLWPHALAPIWPLTYREPNWSRLGTRWLHQSLPVRAATSNSRASGARASGAVPQCVRWTFDYASCWVHLHIPLLCDAMHHELCKSTVPSNVQVQGGHRQHSACVPSSPPAPTSGSLVAIMHRATVHSSADTPTSVPCMEQLHPEFSESRHSFHRAFYWSRHNSSIIYTHPNYLPCLATAG